MENDEIIIEDDKEDLAFSKMTLRDYACIQLKIPKTNLKWLNDLINESKNESSKSDS